MNKEYRFPKYKDASWNSYERQHDRYSVIKHVLGTNSVGAEIGVYKGGFGEFLLPHCRLLYLVDPWYRLKPFWGAKSAENSAVRALIQILTVYTDEIDAGRVQVIPEFSVPFLESLKQDALDWIYLDASHSYDATLAELKAAHRVIRPGGYMIGDDYDSNPESKQHGVFLAVNEFMREHGYDFAANQSRQWAFRVKSS
jgi:hypothetical protein